MFDRFSERLDACEMMMMMMMIESVLSSFLYASVDVERAELLVPVNQC